MASGPLPTLETQAPLVGSFHCWPEPLPLHLALLLSLPFPFAFRWLELGSAGVGFAGAHGAMAAFATILPTAMNYAGYGAPTLLPELLIWLPQNVSVLTSCAVLR